MDRRLRAATLSCLRLGVILLMLPAFAGGAAGQGIEETPLGPPEESVPSVPTLQEGSVTSLPLDAGHPPALSPSGRVVAELRGLDKVTGDARPFEVAVGGEGRFGRLRVRVTACHGREPDQPPEAAAFLQITDSLGGEEKLAFSGWMFASSPGLSAMDHARYDVWVLHCRTS